MTLNDSVEHSKFNNKEIDIYTYTNNGLSISTEEYFRLLEMFLQKEDVTFKYLFFEYDNEYGYTSRDKVEDVKEIRDSLNYGAHDFNACFEDLDKIYSLKYSLDNKKVVKLYSSYKNQDEKNEGQHMKS